jgi:UDP-N-acetylmuramoyl-L-alanyl-D-glutamate--2,6-diaminopimelate ligase
MRWNALLDELSLPVLARYGEADVRSVSADSRSIEPGTCFVAVRGGSHDGHDFVGQALSAGASAVVCEDASFLPDGCETPHAVVPDSAEALGQLAQALRGGPGRKLTCLAVTGTNGKSTVAHLVRAILQQAGHPTGLIGTITYETLTRSVPARMTTPDPVALADLMDEMRSAGATHLVMETSSHALQQRRTAGVPFDVGIFTNLSGDHLDYHGDMDSYLSAKCMLFESLPDRATAVINRDDSRADIIEGCTRARVCWYGLSPAAELQGRIERIDIEGTDVELTLAGESVRLRTPLIGRHNVYNLLAAVAACRAVGVRLQDAAQALEHVEAIPGRLQRVPGPGGDVFVDYAHTDDALANVLGALRPITKGRLIVMFGCGGDRDRSKRPRMAAVACDLADCVVVTSDNPRNEDPAAIIDDILAGVPAGARSKVLTEPDRREAIARAIGLAGSDDVVLLAGKGHETCQIVGQERRDFDDVQIARNLLDARQEAGT